MLPYRHNPFGYLIRGHVKPLGQVIQCLIFGYFIVCWKTFLSVFSKAVAGEQCLRLLYREIFRDHPEGNIDLCTLHFRDWLEEPGNFRSGVASPVTDLRKKVFESLPKNTTIIDHDNLTMAMAKGYGLRSNYFFFELDPESGLEDQMVFTRPNLRRIERQIKSSIAQEGAGLTAYRLMPFAQYVADYVLLRKCWDPETGTDSALEELAADFGLAAEYRPGFVKAMHDLDAWWEESDIESLDACYEALARLAKSSDSAYLADLRDLIMVLCPLAHYLTENSHKVALPDFYPPEDLVTKVRELMLRTRIFEAYTVHQHWTDRSAEMVGQRIRWWLKGMRLKGM